MMNEYTPDNWVVVFLNGDDPHYRVLVGWSGGYLTGDSWRMNSGITRVEKTTETFNINDRTHVAYCFLVAILYSLLCYTASYCWLNRAFCIHTRIAHDTFPLHTTF